MSINDQQYFKLAKDWHFERLEMAQLNANRWFAGFLGACSIIILLTAAIIILAPLKTLIPIIIYKNTTTGEEWVESPNKDYVPETDAQTRSDIVHYITSRESYTAADLNQRFRLIMLLSDDNVGKDYADSQSNNNKISPVNILGATGSRTVDIKNVSFIDKENLQEIKHFNQPSSNLAIVNFTTVTTDQNGIKNTEFWAATIGWVYKGLPQNQQAALDNWDGFCVTSYRVDQANVDN